MVVASTASPYKFVKSVMGAIDETYEQMDEAALFEELKKLSGVEIPNAIKEILDAEILHTRECETDRMQDAVKEILQIK